jgi:hypothetical protein
MDLPHSPTMMVALGTQLLGLLILALPVASVSWTITHEDLFREPREWFVHKSRTAKRLLARKFFYLVTCEYCFSHYVSLLVVVLTDFTLMYSDWRGYVLAVFALVWLANVYMSLFGRLRLDIRQERHELEKSEGGAPHSQTGPHELR